MMSMMRRVITKREMERMTSVMMMMIIMATTLIKMMRRNVKERMLITNCDSLSSLHDQCDVDDGYCTIYMMRIVMTAFGRAMLTMTMKVKSMKSPMTATASSWEWIGGCESYKKE